MTSNSSDPKYKSFGTQMGLHTCKPRRHKTMQEIDTNQASERLALHAAHKSEAQKPFARAAGAIFAPVRAHTGASFGHASLRRNPKINPAERQRLEDEALGRRHQRERFLFERKLKALARLEAREKKSLETNIRRQIYDAEAGRDKKTRNQYDQFMTNMIDVTKVNDAEQVSKPKKSWKNLKSGNRKLTGARPPLVSWFG